LFELRNSGSIKISLSPELLELMFLLRWFYNFLSSSGYLLFWPVLF